MQRVSLAARGFDPGTGKLIYRDRNTPAGIPGSLVLGAQMTTIQEELANIVEANGGVLDPDDNGQVLRYLNGRILRITVFDTAGTHDFTPLGGTKYCLVEGCGGAGAAGGNPLTAAGQIAISQAAGGGASFKGQWNAPSAQTAALGNPIVIGAAGVSSPAAAGTAGSATILAGLTIPGGTGGSAGVIFTGPAIVSPSGGGAIPTWDASFESFWSVIGQPGSVGFALSIALVTGGVGGASPYGAANFADVFGGAQRDGIGHGAGGGAVITAPGNPALSGGAGTPGLLIITEISGA